MSKLKKAKSIWKYILVLAALLLLGNSIVICR